MSTTNKRTPEEDLHGTLAMISYLAGREKVFSPKEGLITMIDVFVEWAKEFDAKHANTVWEEQEECWDEQLYTFLFMKVKSTKDRYQWTYNS